MTETHPPRFAESLLESLGADPEFQDAILGDLAQEHALRVDRYGATAAHAWYYREALLAAPHLFRRWSSGAGMADVRHLLGVAGLAYVTTMIILAAVGFTFYVVVPAVGSWPEWTTSVSVRLAGAYALSVVAPVIGGYFAALYEEKRPLIGAAALACVWTSVILIGAMVNPFLPIPADSPLVVPTWARLALIPFVTAACMIGGAIRVRRADAFES